MTARDYLAAVQQGIDAKVQWPPMGTVAAINLVAALRDRRRMAAALTAVLDLHNAYVSCGNPQHTNFEVECPECAECCEACGEVYPCPTLAAITDALAPKENDS